MYQKAGVITLTLDATKTDYEKFLIQLKQQIQNFPSKVNWKINCPEHLLHEDPDSLSNQLPCELGDSVRTNILEVINLALFNLNNEETDLNLRTTGTQMIILTAGMATYRVNSGIISPTKERILLGGVQVKLISFAREPPYKTPLLIKCCHYKNPFEKRDLKSGQKTKSSMIFPSGSFQQYSSPDVRTAAVPTFVQDMEEQQLQQMGSEHKEAEVKP